MHFDKRTEITNNKSDAIKIQQQQKIHIHTKIHRAHRQQQIKNNEQIYKYKM